MTEINARVLLEEYKLYISKNLSKTTTRSYCSHIEMVLKNAFEVETLNSLNIESLKNMYQLDYEVCLKSLQKEKGYSNSTFNNKSLAISSFYEFLIDKNYLDTNPCEAIARLDYKEREVSILTREELNNLKVASDDVSSYFKRDVEFVSARARAMIYLLIDTGIKTNEVISLDVSMVDFDKKIINLKDRVIPIGRDTARIMKRYLKQRNERNPELSNLKDSAFFISNRGTRISKKVLQTIVDIVAVASGYNSSDITASSIRASYFINLRNEGTSFDDLYRLSGYSTQDAFKQYLDELDTIIDKKKK